MSRQRFRRFAVGVAAVVAAAAASGSAAPSGAAVARIATATTTDFRVVLTAEKRGGGGAPTAVVRLTSEQRIDDRWRRTGAHRLNGTYFWNTVTGPRAVCRLELKTTGASMKPRPRVIVQLLLTPSLGCGRTHQYGLV